ncbi:MAG: osmoprotectant transport system substrate-binding protein opuBD, partial [Solirubrobacteraceae bacterium]|nr:osmoprotectant transport system substrate-binding protein opuBD [Solirubrobacteraceae bacterium]
MRGRLVPAALAAIALPVGLAACGGDTSSSGDTRSGETTTSAADRNAIRPSAANRGKTVKIGSKNFTESITMGYIYGEALKKAGYTVQYDLDLGRERVANRAVRTGRIDGYPEYTGTALTALLGVKPKDVPRDETAAYLEAKRLYR